MEQIQKFSAFPQRALQWNHWGCPAQGLTLLPSDEACSILLNIPQLCKDDPSTFDKSLALSNVCEGYYSISGNFDPLSNFWCGSPVVYDQTMWPTRQHAMSAAKLKVTGTESYPEIRNTMFQFANNDPIRARYYELVASKPQYRQEWISNRVKIVNDILLQSAFQNSHVMMTVLLPEIVKDDYPNTTGYLYQGDPLRRDHFWDNPGQNAMGWVWSDVRYVLRSVATYVKYYAARIMDGTISHIPELAAMGHNIQLSEIPCEVFHYLRESVRCSCRAVSQNGNR